MITKAVKNNFPISYILIILIFNILIPVTSFEYMEMESMNLLQWEYCLMGEGIILLGFWISNHLFSFCKFSKNTKNQKLSNLEISIYVALLIVGIFSYLFYFLKNGTGISSFLSSVNDESNEPFPLYSFFTTIPVLSIFLLLKSGTVKKHKQLWIFIFAFAFLQILTGKRWGFFLLLLFCASLVNYRKIKIKAYIFLLFVIVIAFAFFTLIRSNDSTLLTYRPYLRTKELRFEYRATEIFRYFGMSQRNMTIYLDRTACGTYFQRTSYFLFKLFGMPSNIKELTMVNGYNVTNIIGYMLIDFGSFWWLGLLVWAMALHFIILLSNFKKGSLFLTIFKGAAFLSFSLCFYAYLDTLISFFIVFPIFYFVIYITSHFMGYGGKKNDKNSLCGI